MLDVLGAARALQRSEARFRAAVQAVGVMWTNDTLGRMRGEQPGWAGLTGQTPAEYLDYGWASALHPDDAQPTIDAWNLAVAERRPFSFEHRVRRADGLWRLFAVRAVPVVEDGQVIEWVGVHVDITDSVRNTEQLRALSTDLERQVAERSQERSRTWQVTPDLLSVLNDRGFLTATNPAWQATLGWSPTELEQAPYVQFVHPEDVAASQVEFEKVQRGQPVLRFENRYRAKDGTYRWLSWVAVPEGRLCYCSARDITQEKQLAAELAERTLERDRAWSNSRDLVAVVGADGVFRAVNPAWTHILGHAVAEVVGKSYRDFVWPDDRDETQRELLVSISSHDLTDFENRFRHRDGAPRWLSWRTSRVGELVYAYGRDVTAEKAAASALASAEAQLRQAQKMEAVGQLTGGIAHDFNNLLQVILGNLQLVAKLVADSERASGRVRAAQEAVLRGARLSSQLLAFSRRQTLTPRVIDVGQLVLGMDDLLKRSLGETIALEVVIARDLWPACVDSGQLENSILNLSINARDAMQGRGRLVIEASNAVLDDDSAQRHPDVAPGAYVLVSVTDNGPGMTADVVSKVFEPFFTTKPAGQGTGLGLSMVYGFMRQSGGHARIHSELGHGTAVRLYLPRSIKPVDGVEVQADAGPAQGGNETILVAEDDAAVRATSVAMLAELGYRVLEAATTDEALALVESGVSIDLLFTDMVMPGAIEPAALARAARSRLPTLAVLFTSGYAQHALGDAGAAGDAAALLGKPYTTAALALKVRQTLDAAALPAVSTSAPAFPPAAS